MNKRKLSLLLIFIGVLFLLTSCIKAYEVKFDLGYDNKTLESVPVLKNNKVSEPDDPTREGYAFIEWQLNGEKFDFDTKITENITLVATWGQETSVVLIEFDSNGGTLTDPQIIPKGTKASKPNDPTKEGFKFLGWYFNDELFNFDGVLVVNVVLEARWVEVVKVVFSTEYSTKILLVEVNSKINASDIFTPTKEGFNFLGWYLDDKEFDFNSVITKGIVLQAKWKPETFVLVVPNFIDVDKDNLNSIEKGEEVTLTINLEEGITLEELLINDVDVTELVVDNKYSFIMEDNTLVTASLKYELVEGSFGAKEKVTTAIPEGSINSYLNIINGGNSNLDIKFSANGSTTKAIFNNDAKETRLYPGSTNGGSLIIELEEGFEIEKIEIETGTQNAGFSVNGKGVYTYVSKTEVIILDEPSNIVEIKNIANDTTGNRVDLKNIKIHYNKTLKTEDLVAPVITLNTGVKLNYQIGDIWNNEEALLWVSVFDNVDGTDLAITLNDDLLYEALIVNGSLVFDREGSYQIIYSATDSSGNVGSLIVVIKVFSASLEDLSSLDYSGFSNYYSVLNNSDDVISDLAFLLRETITYVTYGEARFLYVPYSEGSDKQVVMYDYDGRDNTYQLIPFSWGSGGEFTLSNGRSVKLEREHVWACNDMMIYALGNDSKKYQGYEVDLTMGKDEYRPGNSSRGHYSDLHNLWLSIGSANGTHSNYFYGEEDGPKASYYLKNSIFYPGEEYVGDIARILFYMTLMYPHLTLVEKDDPNAGVLGNIYYGYLDVLLYWNEIDPPSDYEIVRNNLIFNKQGNRNPFVDFYYQGFADILFSYGDPNVLDN